MARLAVATALAVVLSHAALAQQPASANPIAAPESVGMSGSRLERLTPIFTKEVESKQLPGVSIMVARKGRVVYVKSFGVRDPSKPDAMQVDSLFRIYSMTKPMASVAAMILVEEGRLQLSDPVSKQLPAFKDMKVITSNGEAPATRAMTVQDLLRHTSDLTYGELNTNPVIKEELTKAGLAKPGVIDFDARDMSAAEQVERLAKVPLLHPPGSAWEYSLSTDLLGRVIEVASGKRLGDFMAERIFRPLKMNDTAFFVPEAKMSRLAALFDKDPVTGNPFRLIDVSKQPGNDSAGADAVSTVPDYMRFA